MLIPRRRSLPLNPHWHPGRVRAPPHNHIHCPHPPSRTLPRTLDIVLMPPARPTTCVVDPMGMSLSPTSSPAECALPAPSAAKRGYVPSATAPAPHYAALSVTAMSRAGRCPAQGVCIDALRAAPLRPPTPIRASSSWSTQLGSLRKGVYRLSST
ncbi:hypothetical protein R3P38DRAFT_3241809 [Favolaschia claudopus]|uniref:Uncharacterized protein n=1 Tax=Favolaschia claudopus TaxID=2862362 RepID=A0AAV9Z5F6_9AGAR